MTNLLTYFPEFVLHLAAQLEEDDKRYGCTWKLRNREHQVGRFRPWVEDCFDKLEHGTMSDAEKQVEYLKLAGNAFINWIRDTYPEEYQKLDRSIGHSTILKLDITQINKALSNFRNLYGK